MKIATQPSIWDSENLEEYKSLYIHPKWENWSAFDPSFRWAWREERAVRRKVDWKIMVWNLGKMSGHGLNSLGLGLHHVCCTQYRPEQHFQRCLGQHARRSGPHASRLCKLHRTAASHILAKTYIEQNLGKTIGRVGFLVAELPSQIISKRSVISGQFLIQMQSTDVSQNWTRCVDSHPDMHL
jgi:hypothetical protein